MAGFFERFTKPLWSNKGTTVEPVDAQADAGFGFLANEPPSVELFNAIFQWLDGKDKWLYQQIASVLAASNITPTEQNVLALRDALNLQFQSKALFPSTLRRNLLINSQFTIFQRGAGPFTAQYDYGPDRWTIGRIGGSTSAEVKVATEADRIELGDPRLMNYLRVTVNGGAGADSFAQIAQRMESVYTLAGKPATLSFAIRRVGGVGDVAAEYAQIFGPGAAEFSTTTVLVPTTNKIAVTPTWRRVSVGASIPQHGSRVPQDPFKSALQASIFFSSGSQRSGRLNGLGVQSGVFDIAMIQVEEGTQATNYDDVPSDIEFLRCMRFYQRLGIGLWGLAVENIAGSTLSSRFVMGFQSMVPMATTAPTLDILNNNWYVHTSRGYITLPGVQLAYMQTNPPYNHKITMDHGEALPAGQMLSMQDANYAALTAEFRG